MGCTHHLHERADPEILDRTVVTARDVALLRDFTSSNFPTASGDVLLTKVCLFTNTPDEHFIIDRHPEHPQIVIGSPCSGHGFKFGALIGAILADLAERGATEHPIGMFGLGRPELGGGR
jgi:sarcosine oxidase